MDSLSDTNQDLSLIYPLLQHNTTQCAPTTPFATSVTPYGGALQPYPLSQNVCATPTPSANRKTAKRKNKENELPGLQPPEKRQKLSLQLSTLEKVKMFFGFIKEELEWTYGEAICMTGTALSVLNHLDTQERKEREAKAAKMQDPWMAAAMLQPWSQSRVLPYTATDAQVTSTIKHFLKGAGDHIPSKIIGLWYEHPYGRQERDSELMFATAPPYTTIRPVRPALSSFAAQIVESRLVKEAEEAVGVKSGLHVTLSTKQHQAKRIQWTDIGATTVERTQAIIQECQPLTWAFLMKLAARPPRVRNGVTAVRTKRPPELVVTSAISNPNFSRSSQAKLLPLATALLYYGSQVSSDIFRYHSRTGTLLSRSSTSRAMVALSEHEAQVTLAHGQDPSTIAIMDADNVQNYLLQRDPGIGHENKMNIGIFATYREVDLDGQDISIFDLDKQMNASESRAARESLTTDKLRGLIDQSHLERVCLYQWISVLLQHVPSLAHLKPELTFAYGHRVSKLKMKVQSTKMHPLASSGRNETIMTDLKAALEDFLAQAGQTTDSHHHRLFPVGGDGLTFEKLHHLRELLQLHSNDLEAMRIVKPILNWFHTEWTNLSRIFEAHWGDPYSNDPSTLGHSALKIGRKKPPNLKKVDFYTSTDLAFLVLDVRILDCWRIHFKQDDIFKYFEELEAAKKTPTFDELELIAKSLYRDYTSLRAQQKAMRGYVSTKIPNGTVWDTTQSPKPVESDSASSKKKKTKSKPLSTPETPFKGDQVLAKSIAFMRETMHAREMTLATAQGDPGRIWEVIKVMLFTFAGSSHSKYTQYLLEVIVDFELECSAELREALLKMTLVNLRGIEGHWSAGDFIQEYFNRLLEAVVQRKGVDYGDRFIRNTWSRNIHHVGRLKLEWLEGVGLKRRSAKHAAARKGAEVRILLELYKETELHNFRQGRTFDHDEYVDNFQNGIFKLREGKLKRWVRKTTRARGLHEMVNSMMDGGTNADESENEEDEEDDTDDEDQSAPDQQTLRFATVVDGELVVDGFNQEQLGGSLPGGEASDESESEGEDD